MKPTVCDRLRMEPARRMTQEQGCRPASRPSYGREVAVAALRPASQSRPSNCDKPRDPKFRGTGGARRSSTVFCAPFSAPSSSVLTSVAMADKITRIAIVDSNRCKPKRCAQECKKVCTQI